MPHPGVVFGGLKFRASVPAALTSEAALLAHLGVTAAELKKIWWFRGRMYHEFEISKTLGKSRIISAPDRRLKMLQRNIASLLDEMYKPRHPVHGFVPHRSVVTNATSYFRSKFVVNLDIEGFFTAISENRVAGLLKALGVQSGAADIVARICCNRGCLPQGAPSSPVISNMICFAMDKELQRFAKAAHCIYTRYADDVSFSSYQPLTALFDAGLPASGNFDPGILASRLKAAFVNNGFAINKAKTHYADRHSRRIVTGLKINEGLNVDRRFIRDVRSTLYSIDSLGLADAQKKFEDKYGGTCEISNFLKGKISWIGSVKGRSDPVFRSLAGRFNDKFPAKAFKLQPTRDEVRKRAVWVIEHFVGDFAQGSAFFLKGVGLVTASHCVVEAAAAGAEIDVYHPTKPSNVFKATVKQHCEIRDLAILDHNIPENEFYELEISEEQFVVGDSLSALGYPKFAPGDGMNVRNGNISAFSVKHAVPLIEVTQMLTQGMSGGPVVDSGDKLAGIIHKGGPEEGRDFAVHVKALTDWLGL
ncbi:reverse transcriptase domain-containing protein [Rhizobium sp. CBN3]|uniref:reverse transcriptase domain-containing protein n=1 Tax=Rhizobium sp. CBN3 TaxID=3058045 RepID=UPI0026728D8A|nr:reverse transcriptase domain-containing protein [Rhizobium sp. CBN3]MDO3432119.1 reverse transcriptase domain-containing protein [Rhizobium sp. CBN3]